MFKIKKENNCSNCKHFKGATTSHVCKECVRAENTWINWEGNQDIEKTCKTCKFAEENIEDINGVCGKCNTRFSNWEKQCK